MNCYYGIRIRKAFRSDEDWYDINEYGGRVFIRWSFGIIVCGIILMFIPVEDLIRITPFLGVCPIVVFAPIALIRTSLFARRR